VTRTVTRRQVLRWGIAGAGVAIFPGRGLLGCGGTVSIPQDFLSAAEQQLVTAATARIVPTDDVPGAVEAGVTDYINRLLSILPDEASPGVVFAGGPFSNRNPFPAPSTGTPSAHFPADNFAQFLPLTRLQLLSWRVQLLGTAAVPGSDFNVAALGPVIGLRDRYRAGLAEIHAKSAATFGAEFAALTSEQQDQILAAIAPSFLDLLTGHTLEGLFCAPEYGGNRNRVGWELIHYDGDSQPLGYAIFDATTMSYQERPDKPNSTVDGDEDFAGVDANTDQFLRSLVKVVGTPHFP
jgi:gluconate 2-dehydrogenase gamma chain